MCVFFSLTDRASTPVIYALANPVRGLLDRKRSEEHLQGSNENIKKESATGKKKGNKKQKTTQKRMPKNMGINRMFDL